MTFLLAFLVTLLVPDSPDTLYRQPQLAADARMAVLAFGAGDGVYFAASADHGKTFSAPVKVAAAGKLALGRHRGPRIALTARAIVITAIA